MCDFPVWVESILSDSYVAQSMPTSPCKLIAIRDSQAGDEARHLML